MREDTQSVPPSRQNDAGLVHAHIQSELEKVGVNLRQISLVGDTVTVTTDNEVPEATRSGIRDYAAYKGFRVTLLTS
jgi:hypothetical protein